MNLYNVGKRVENVQRFRSHFLSDNDLNKLFEFSSCFFPKLLIKNKNRCNYDVQDIIRIAHSNLNFLKNSVAGDKWDTTSTIQWQQYAKYIQFAYGRTMVHQNFECYCYSIMHFCSNTSFFVIYLTLKCIITLDYRSYSSDLTPYDYFLIMKLKIPTKGIR